MNRTNTPELVGNGKTEGLSIRFQLHELKGSRNVMLERIVSKVTGRSSTGMTTTISDFESELVHLKDYGMKLAWR